MEKRDTPTSLREAAPALKRLLTWGGFFLAVVLCITAILALVVLGPRGTTKRCMNAYLDADGAKVFDLAFPEAMLEREYGSEESQQKAKQLASTQLQERLKVFTEKDPNWSVTCKVSKPETITGDRLQTIRDLYYREYRMEVAAAKAMTVTMVFTVNGETITKEAQMVAMRIGLRWYVDLVHSKLPVFA